MNSSNAFPVLSDSDYVNYIGPINYRGQNQTIHLAEIRYPTQNTPITSVVKLLPKDGLLACNEAISWLFLRAAGVPTPTNAGILILSKDKADNIFEGRNITYDQSDEYVLAWASRKINFDSIKVLFGGNHGDEKWLSVLNTTEGAAIAAFDEVFLNIDRNTGNILFSSDTSCIPIDHELTFAMQDWIKSDLIHKNYDGDSLNTLKEARLKGKISIESYSQTINHMVFHAEKHAQALQDCSEHITNLLETIYSDQSEDMAYRILSFVAERTGQEWIKERLGVI